MAEVSEITPDDNTTSSPRYRWLWIGGAGSVALVTAAGDTVTIAVPSDGTRLPIATVVPAEFRGAARVLHQRLCETDNLVEVTLRAMRPLKNGWHATP